MNQMTLDLLDEIPAAMAAQGDAILREYPGGRMPVFRFATELLDVMNARWREEVDLLEACRQIKHAIASGRVREFDLIGPPNRAAIGYVARRAGA
jgi:hypothetical protein